MPLVERRYAEAFINIAAGTEDIDSLQEELQGLMELFKSQPVFRTFMLDPEIKTENKKAVVRKAFSNNLKTETVNLLLLLLDKGRIKFLPGIYEEFVRMADKKKNILNMTVYSAAGLDESQVERIKDKYKKLYNASTVKAEVRVDTALIGGVKVKIGDKVIDDSLKGRLESLKELLIK
jgi:F-type H+-transporting ATPase subunit delta